VSQNPQTAITVYGLLLHASVGAALTTVTIGTFIDNAGLSASSYTITVGWGDGTIGSSAPRVGGARAASVSIRPTGVVAQYAVTGSHTYTSNGTFPINVTIHATDGRTAYLSSNAEIVAQGPATTSIFTTQTPAATYSGAYELGVKFQSSVAGHITGLRYYKPANETGSHVGHLWSAAGTLLSTVTFSGESASGWQSALFTTPIAINANITYVASVNSNTALSYTSYGLSTAVSNGPLSTVVGNNGVYSTTRGAFPTVGTAGTNYFRDVVFTAS
ncbi:MAG TPA: DUF4082 domain-containing protein, partial [Chloroflexota bacterium]|nr:DUF4082 domain-containing protein [Chloroflexota bacterium]